MNEQKVVELAMKLIFKIMMLMLQLYNSLFDSYLTVTVESDQKHVGGFDIIFSTLNFSGC